MTEQKPIEVGAPAGEIKPRQDPAPYGYKKDGTPRRRAVPRRNVLEESSPAFDARPVNVQTTRRRRSRVDGMKRRIPDIRLPPDWVGHWFVDDDGDPEKGIAGSEIHAAYNRDWNFVRVAKDGRYEITGDNLGTNMSIVANRRTGGACQYLMAKRRELHEEDRKNGVDKINDEIEMALKPDRAIAATPAGADPKHFYSRQDGETPRLPSAGR